MSSQLSKLKGKPKGKSDKSRGKDKDKNPYAGPGRGKGNTQSYPTSLCPLCQKGYHWMRDCWCNPSNPNGEAGTPRSPKGPKGPGRGQQQQSHQGDAGKGPKCCKCQEFGHVSKDCPKKVNELAEQPTDGNLGGLFMSALGASDVIRRNAVHRTGRELQFGIDSGAAVTAIPPEFVEQYPFAEPSNGLKYQSATGEGIANLGMRKPFIDVKGELRGVR